MNVTALVDASSGNVVERYAYNPCGKVTIHDDDWSDTVAWDDSKKNEILTCGYRLEQFTIKRSMPGGRHWRASRQWHPLGEAGHRYGQT